ncbi:OST-HTH/LOTUS domain-containing protein [Escherichia coli]|uniref:OST-HTH/LOTUS domain-containing protein n=1 Tax=Escherichia coli TaxID=562 RepID=UPI0023B8B6E0|nr:OST-HTH/LOTUS domain-containing protein [Escherichia coli]
MAAAGRWIADRHPEQLPAKYGCSSWRQVVHECRLFELRYREVEGQRAAWYRPREA